MVASCALTLQRLYTRQDNTLVLIYTVYNVAGSVLHENDPGTLKAVITLV